MSTRFGTLTPFSPIAPFAIDWNNGCTNVNENFEKIGVCYTKLLLSILFYSPHCVQDFLQKCLTFLLRWGFFKPFVEHVLKGLTFLHGWLQYPFRARIGQFFLALQRFCNTFGTASLHFDTTDRCCRLSCSFPKNWLKYQCKLLEMSYI